MCLVTNVSYTYKVNGNCIETVIAKRGIRQGDPISPLLFVIMIEYLNICLVKLQKNPTFQHHARCKSLGLTNLTFADDILLFCRGGPKSVELMMDVFQLFSDSTGLIFNPSKCRAFYGNVDQDSITRIKKITGFEHGSFPVRYLGVPLSSKRLNIQHYHPLIDKITTRVRHWTAKLLSYVGRIQLIKSII